MREIGPIPTRVYTREPDPQACMEEPPAGPSPAWGGYRAVQARGAWEGHVSCTPLRRDGDLWWVSAPDDRPAMRTVSILRDCIAEGADPADVRGVRPDERAYVAARPSSRDWRNDPDLAAWCAGWRGDALDPEYVASHVRGWGDSSRVEMAHAAGAAWRQTTAAPSAPPAMPTPPESRRGGEVQQQRLDAGAQRHHDDEMGGLGYRPPISSCPSRAAWEAEQQRLHDAEMGGLNWSPRYW